MADNTVSHAQKPGGSSETYGWHGVKTNNVRRPLTNEEIDRFAAALRARQGLDNHKPTPTTFGQQYGIPKEFAQFIQRLEGRISELENRLKALEQPAHLANLEKR